jgi:hypothetical protein
MKSCHAGGEVTRRLLDCLDFWWRHLTNQRVTSDRQQNGGVGRLLSRRANGSGGSCTVAEKRVEQVAMSADMRIATALSCVAIASAREVVLDRGTPKRCCCQSRAPRPGVNFCAPRSPASSPTSPTRVDGGTSRDELKSGWRTRPASRRTRISLASCSLSPPTSAIASTTR